MAFTVSDFRDLLKLLEAHPEWRGELRRHVLGEEWVEVPALIRAMAEAQRHTDENLAALAQRVDALAMQVAALAQRMDDLTLRVDTLTQRLDVLTQRVDDLTQRLDTLTQRVDTLTQRVDDLTQRVDALTQRVDDLTQQVAALTQRVDDLRGEFHGFRLEWRYQQHPDAYFGRLLRRLRVHAPGAVVDEYEHQLSRDEMLDLLEVDMLLQGVPRETPARGEVWLAVEISTTVDRHDLDRALRRAAALRKAGLHAVPTVAGNRATDAALRRARTEHILLLQDGRITGWDEAVAAWAA